MAEQRAACYCGGPVAVWLCRGERELVATWHTHVPSFVRAGYVEEVWVMVCFADLYILKDGRPVV